jgi:hypothetical protein
LVSVIGTAHPSLIGEPDVDVAVYTDDFSRTGCPTASCATQFPNQLPRRLSAIWATDAVGAHWGAVLRHQLPEARDSSARGAHTGDGRMVDKAFDKLRLHPD